MAPPFGELIYSPNYDLINHSEQNNPESAPLFGRDHELYYYCDYALYLDLLGAAEAYNSYQYPYWPYPTVGAGTYNSNGFTAGLFECLGYDTANDGLFPYNTFDSLVGWSRPVPIQYNPQYENDSNICGMSSESYAQKVGELKKKQKKSNDGDKPRPYMSEETSPLIRACERGELSDVRSIMREKGQLQTVSKYGYTPLIVAASHGRFEVVKYLVAQGAGIDERDLNGLTTPLIAAAGSGSSETVKFLLEKGAKINGRGDYGINPFAAAILGGHNKVAQVLAEAGADPDAPVEQATPLMIAVQYGSYDLVKTILAAKPNLSKRYKNGETALDMARKARQTQIVDLIEQNKKL
jgi:ankyrin repeat protein